MELFPMFLKLEGRKCLVVGGGAVAQSKVESLVRCGADVRVIAPAVSAVLRNAALRGEITWEQREFVPSDLMNIFLVVAATSSPELHEQIYLQARDEGVLCNAVDEPERCDFYYPATVRRGPLQIAISTGGNAPSLAQRLREELELQFGPEYGPWTEEVGRARSRLLAQPGSPESRREILRKLSSERAFEEFQRQRKTVTPAVAAGTVESTEPRSAEAAGGKVYFVGAGPGDPDLLTLQAWKILSVSDVVLHDALVAPEIVGLAAAEATIHDVGKRCGQQSIRQEEIHRMMIDYAFAGRTVVRLQGGDPLIFGRAGEEIAALRVAGVAFEIIPGVTAASAAAAAAGISLTDRRFASKVVFLSGHRQQHDAAPDGVQRNTIIPAGMDTTYAIYMPGSDYSRIARDMREAGLPGRTPCMIISQAFMPQQAIRRTDLASLDAMKSVSAPALLIVGKVGERDGLEACEAENSRVANAVELIAPR